MRRVLFSALIFCGASVHTTAIHAQNADSPPTDSRDLLRLAEGEHVYGAELGTIIFGPSAPDCNQLTFRVATESDGILEHFESTTAENLMEGAILQAARICRLNASDTVRASLSVEQFGIPIADVTLSGPLMPANYTADVTLLTAPQPALLSEYDAYWEAYPRYIPDRDRFAELARLGYSDFAYALGVTYDWQGYTRQVYFGAAPFSSALQIDRDFLDLTIRSGHPTAAYLDTRSIISDASEAERRNPATLPEDALLTLTLRIAQGMASGHATAISYARLLQDRGVDITAATTLVGRLDTTTALEDLRAAPASDATPTAAFAVRALNEALVLDRYRPGANFLEIIAMDDEPLLTWVMSSAPIFERRNNGCAVRVLTSAVALSVRSVDDLTCSGDASGYTCTMRHAVSCFAFNPWASQNPTVGLTAAANFSLCAPIELQSFGLSATFARDGARWVLTSATRTDR